MRTAIFAATVVLAGCGVLASPALAVSIGDTVAGGNLDVTLTVDPSCAITVTALDFGTVTALATDKNESSQGDVAVTCTQNAKYSIGLGEGEGPSATIDTRQLSNTADGVVGSGNEHLGYQLYFDGDDRDEDHVWGDTVGTDTVDDVGTGSSQSHPVYGVVAAHAVSLGSYSDTVVATVWYEGVDELP
jgi:spore coat protein U-like protein